jgi:hypothetical protein
MPLVPIAAAQLLAQTRHFSLRALAGCRLGLACLLRRLASFLFREQPLVRVQAVLLVVAETAAGFSIRFQARRRTAAAMKKRKSAAAEV